MRPTSEGRRRDVEPPPVRHVFCLPRKSRLPSGGNIYNRLLIQALRAEGVPIEAVRGPAEASLRARRARPGEIFWFDSLDLGRIGALAPPRATGARTGLVVHGLPSLEPGIPAAERRKRIAGERRAVARCGLFLTTSRYARGALLRRGAGRKPIIVVPPALAVRPRGSPAKPPGCRALVVGNLIRGKGILELLRALAKRLSPDDGFDLRVAGRFDIEPKYARECRDFARSQPAWRGKVEFLGPEPLRKMPRVYGACHILLHPSRQETYGMALREAAAFGLWILALRAGPVDKDAVPAARGELFPSIDSLAERAVDLARRPAELRRLLARARHRFEDDGYTWRSAGRSLLSQLTNWLTNS